MRLLLIIAEGKRRAPPHTDHTRQPGFRLQQQLYSDRHSAAVNGSIKCFVSFFNSVYYKVLVLFNLLYTEQSECEDTHLSSVIMTKNIVLINFLATADVFKDAKGFCNSCFDSLV